MKQTNARSKFCGQAAAIALLASGLFWTAPALATNGPAQELPANVRDMVQRAGEATKRGDFRVATLLLKNALQAAPQQTAIRAQLGTVLAMQGNMPEAERTLRDARAQGAPDAAVLPALFQAMLSRGEGQALLKEFPEPQDRSPVAADTFRARALAEFSLKDAAAANDQIDKSLAIRRTPQSLVNKAQFAVNGGDRASAAALVDEALRLAPQDQSALVMKVGILERNNDNNTALTYADQLVKAYPNQVLARVLRVELLAKLHQDARAETDVNWLLANAPTLAIAKYDQALLQARKGDVKGAWNIIQALPPEFLRTQPQFGLGAAQIAQASGNAEVSDAMLQSVISTYPDNEDARLMLAERRLQQKNPKAALALLTPIKAGDPRYLSLMAKTYQALGQAAEAKDYTARASLASLKGGQGASMDQLAAANRDNPADPDIASALVALLIRDGKLDQAQQVSDRFAAAAKNDPMVPFFRGQLLMARGDLDGAADAFNTTLKAKQGDPASLFYRSEIAAARGDLTAANADLDAILQTAPANTQALAAKAQYALQAGHGDDAEKYLKTAIAAASADPAPRLALASFYLSRKDYAKAQATTADILRQNPADPNAASLMVRIQLTQNQPAQAKATAANFVQASKNSEQAQLLLGDVLARAKDPGAGAAYQNAVRIGHDSRTANVKLIAYYAGSGDKAKAIETARGYASRHPSLDSDLMLADTLITVGQADAAKPVLQAALAKPRNAQSVLLLANLQGRLDADKGKAILSDWVKANGNDMTARMQLANVYLADGNLDAARPHLEQIVRAQPYNASALNDLAWVLQKSDPKRALKLSAQAVKVSPQSGEMLDTMAWLMWQQNDRAASLPLLRKAHDLSPQDPNVAYHLAVALQATGDKANAVQVLDAAVKANPSARNTAEMQRLKAQWQ